MKIVLSSWYGRFGNNIVQLSNACNYALENNYYFESPYHNLIKPITINKHIMSNNIFCDYFFHGFDQYNHNRHNIIQEYIKSNLQHIHKIDLDNETLVIHIRSGDIFSDNPNPKYIQNPLSYFVSIIDRFKKTIVVCENDKNPIINILSSIKSVTIRSGTLIEDLSIMLSARNLCLSGVGTFGPICAMLSDSIKNLFITNIVNIDNQWIFNSNICIYNTHIDLSKYILPNSWKNNSIQRSLMMNYQI